LENNLKRTLISSIARTTGAHSEVWDGKDDAGTILPASGYTITISAQSGSSVGWYQSLGGLVSNGAEISDFNTNQNIDPYKNEICQINYILSQNAMVSIRAGENVSSGGTSWAIIDWEVRLKGANIEFWDGRDGSGNITAYDNVVFAYWTISLPENTIIIVKDKTTKPIIASDPYAILPWYGELTTIKFTLYKTATVTLSVCSPDGTTTIKTLLNNVEKSAGTYELTWSGKDENGKTVSYENSDLRIKLVTNSSSSDSQTILGNITTY
jgi:flagellar hook assembly protein FlgD